MRRVGTQGWGNKVLRAGFRDGCWDGCWVGCLEFGHTMVSVLGLQVPKQSRLCSDPFVCSYVLESFECSLFWGPVLSQHTHRAKQYCKPKYGSMPTVSTVQRNSKDRSAPVKPDAFTLVSVWLPKPSATISISSLRL